MMASMPESQLRATVMAGTEMGTPAMRAETRAMLAASEGWATQPMITWSIRLGSRLLRSMSA